MGSRKGGGPPGLVSFPYLPLAREGRGRPRLPAPVPATWDVSGEAQPAGEFYTARADFVVENGPGAQVEEAVEQFLNQLEENTRL